MGKIVVCTMISIDGYTEGPGGNVMALPMDVAFAQHNTERTRTASSFLFGATTYRGALTYWPSNTTTRTPRHSTTTSPSGTPTASPSPSSRTR